MRALPEAHSSCQLPAIFPPGERTKPCRDRSRFRRKSDPLPMASSSYRDRTSEFRSLTETLQKIGGAPAAVNPPEARAGAPGDASPASARSEFNKRAARIGLGISETSQKIARLAKLAKRSSMFDDPTVEIQQLTSLIKDDITALNIALQDLQTLQNIEMSGGNYSEDKAVHSNHCL
ncbi:hypothetical protein NL676_037032 [Syzygium grande]|nr:hypothetical protein NL676_037032 [Syzygium grande]